MQINVETSQNVVLEFNVANVGDRILAQLIDILAYFIYFIIIVTVLLSIASFTDGDTVWVVFTILQLPIMFYSLFCEIVFNGQTLGKYFMKIKVVKLDGTQPGFLDYFIRWIMRIIDIWLFWGFVAIVTVIANGKGQRLGDIAAGTALVKLNNKPFFANSIYRKLTDNHKLTFPQVKLLSENDINIINDVLKAYVNFPNNTALLLLNRTFDEVKKKTLIETTMHPRLFFDTLIRDYNYLNKEVNA